MPAALKNENKFVEVMPLLRDSGTFHVPIPSMMKILKMLNLRHLVNFVTAAQLQLSI